MELNDTIAAIASGNQSAARGTIRISGPDAMNCVDSVFSSDDKSPIEIRRAIAIDGHFQLPTPFTEIESRVYCWPNRQSYTRQPSAEFHLIGSLPILNAALRTICDNGARLAEPGEFTLRAFLAGRLDLTQAEAVLGVIDAQDQNELNVALEQLAGGLAQPLADLRNELIELLAHLEAGLDFVEEDIEFISTNELCESLARVKSRIDELRSRMTGRDLRDQLPNVVLIGWPNAGKSSLFNRLCGIDRAIVTSQSGTTRDYLEQQIDIDDSKFRLIDTAGFESREDDTSIESAAQEMTESRRERADLKLLCIDPTRDLNQWELDQVQNCDESTIVVITKCDLSKHDLQLQSLASKVHTSAESGTGIDELKQLICDRVQLLMSTSDVVVAETARRSADSLLCASRSVEQAIEIAQANAGEELVAAELRISLDEIGRVVGAIYTDDILDQVFSRFCIGK